MFAEAALAARTDYSVPVDDVEEINYGRWPSDKAIRPR
jgi:hypothetical protein